MPDIAEGRTAVREATRRAEEAAGVFRDGDGNETYADQATPVATPELEGAVPVSASDQPLPVEPAPAATPAEAPQTPEPPVATLTVDELQAEVTRLNEQLATKDSFIGRQSTDVGELRAELEALRTQVTTAAAPQVVEPQLAITQQLIDEDPARATQLAFEQNNPQALAVAFEAWKEEDEFSAASWRYDKLLEKQQADFKKELEAVRGEVAEVKAPQAAAAERNVWSDAFLEMTKSYPDFLTVDAATGKTNAQRLLEEVAPQFPAVAELIADGDVAAKVQGLTLLYDKGKLGNPAAMAAELQDAADDAAASAAAARAAASAVNGQSSAGQGTAVELTEEQEEIEKYKARYSGGVSLARGWTGRSA